MNPELQRCPACGTELDEEQFHCPHCDFQLEWTDKRNRTSCPTCQGSGRVTRWHYHQQCYRDSDNGIHIFRNEPALRILMENALRQCDYHFEELPPHEEPSDPRINGLIYFDSYRACCPTCGGSGKLREE